MLLSCIDILNFKNIPQTKLELSPGANCLLGANGMGKSNLLEAIHFLCLARPMQPIPETALIRHGQEMLMVKGRFELDTGTSSEISVGIVKGKGKSLRNDGKEYPRMSEHIGRFPVVTIAPRDSELVSGSGEERRKLMDMVISQADPVYLSYLIRYTRALESRNKMLRAGITDDLLYESIETGLCEAAKAIHSARQEWVRNILPAFSRYYSAISGDAETASIVYKSVLNDYSPEEILKETRAKDRILGFTSKGVHRDDLETKLDDWSMRRLGSQGQVKTFTVALRLAIFDYLRTAKKITPLLLLDDIFDKLDSSRVGRIMELVSRADNFRQVFITDTNREHLDEILSTISGDRLLLSVDSGTFTPLNRPEFHRPEV